MKRALLALARTRAGVWLLGWLLIHTPFAIPAARLHETPTLIAFRHPQPAYAVHILLVPRRPIRSMTDLGPADAEFLVDVFATVRLLVTRFGMARYRVIVNGGEFQGVPYLHFHLVSDAESEVKEGPG